MILGAVLAFLTVILHVLIFSILSSKVRLQNCSVASETGTDSLQHVLVPGFAGYRMEARIIEIIKQSAILAFVYSSLVSFMWGFTSDAYSLITLKDIVKTVKDTPEIAPRIEINWHIGDEDFRKASSAYQKKCGVISGHEEKFLCFLQSGEQDYPSFQAHPTTLPQTSVL